MANVNFMTLAVWRLFRCQAYDKKVRWTFFSYIAGNVKLSIFDIILTTSIIACNKNITLFISYALISQISPEEILTE